MEEKPGIFDNQFLDFNETLSSIYKTTHINEQHPLDGYIMYQKDNDVSYSNIAGHERRALLGLRHFGKMGSFNFIYIPLFNRCNLLHTTTNHIK